MDGDLKQVILDRIQRILISIESQTCHMYSDLNNDLTSVIDILAVLSEHHDIGGVLDTLNEAQDHLQLSLIHSDPVKSECQTYFTGCKGRPSFVITRDMLEFYISSNFTAKRIAELTGVSRRTICRRLVEFNLSMSDKFSDLTDLELDDKVLDILNNFPNIGYRSVKGHLISKGIVVQEYRVRESMRHVDLDGVLYRRMTLKPISRRKYNVRAPLALWHIDGYHKLIRWHMVVHGGIDGYSRLPVYLQIANNNSSGTVLGAFLSAIDQYGTPERVRSDKGGENILVAEYMLRNHGTQNGAFITGRSVHNQRIERFWRDLWTGCISIFHRLFCYLEQEYLYVPGNPIHEQALLYVFIPRIQKQLDDFVQAYIRMPLRSEHNQTPLQLWIAGQILDPKKVIQTQVELDMYGVDGNSPTSSENDSLAVELDAPCPIPEDTLHTLREQCDPLAVSDSCGVDIFESVCRVLEQ